MHAQVPWACLRLGKLLQDWPQDGTVAGGAAAAAAAAVGARAAGAAEGVADPLLATHVPRPGRGTELLASARAPSPSSALPQQQQLQLQLQPSAVPPPGLSAGGDSGVQEVPLRLLPLWAFPGSAPDSCLRRNVAGRAARDAAVQPQLPLKELMGLKLADRVSGPRGKGANPPHDLGQVQALALGNPFVIEERVNGVVRAQLAECTFALVMGWRLPHWPGSARFGILGRLGPIVRCLTNVV